MAIKKTSINVFHYKFLFGKYKGQYVSDVFKSDFSYIEFMLPNFLDPLRDVVAELTNLYIQLDVPKTHLTDFIKHAINKKSVDEQISSDELAFLVLKAIIKHHPDPNKIQGEIKYFTVKRCEVNCKNKNLCFVDDRGHNINFSWHKCVNNLNILK